VEKKRVEIMEDLDIGILTKRSVHGILALISRQFFLNTISFGASLVIFTYLNTHDIGVFIAVSAMQRILGFFTDFGFGAALVQKKEKPLQEDLMTFFTLQVIVTLGVFILIFFLRSIIVSFYQLSEEAWWLLLVLVFSMFLSSFKIIPSILLERTVNFQKLVLPQIMESLIFNILLVVLVLNKFNLASYSWAFFISGLVSIPFYYVVSPWKIAIGINKHSLKHLKYGVAFQAKNILATIKDDLLTVVLAKLLTFTELSYIGFAQKFAFYAFRYVVDSVTKVTFSTYSRIQDRPDYMKKAIERSLFFVSVIMFPVLMGLIITAPYIISFIPRWQNKWQPAEISLAFFCLNALVSSFSNILVNVLDATGRVKTTLRLMVLWTTLTWALTPVIIYFVGYNGVSIASFLVTLTIFYTVYLVKKIVVFNFIQSIYKPFFGSLVMSIVVYNGAGLFVVDFFTLSAMIPIGAIVYFTLMYLFAWKELREDVKFIFPKL